MKIANAHAGTNTWTLRLFTFLVWTAVGLCAAYWAFKFVTTKPVEATAAIAAPAVAIDSKAVGKLLGATDNVVAKPVTISTVKLALFGLATTVSGHGVALIATEDKPAKPYRVGAKVTDDLVLKSISKVDAVLATSTTAPDGQKLSLPDRKPATLVAAAGRPQLQGSSATLPAYPNTVGTLNPAVAESLRQPPVSRFAPRPAGSAGAAGVPPGAPAMLPVMPPAMPLASTINPAAAASSAAAAAASAVTPPSAVGLKPDTDGAAR
jgi:general secretion pathway protein C